MGRNDLRSKLLGEASAENALLKIRNDLLRKKTREQAAYIRELEEHINRIKIEYDILIDSLKKKG